MKFKVFFWSLFSLPLLVGWGQGEKRDALQLYRQGNYQGAVEVCLQELASYREAQLSARMDSYTVLGWSLVRLRRYEDAKRYGEEALTWSRYDARIIETLGEVYYYLGDYEQGLKYFREYVSISPNGDLIGQVYYYMGEIYIRMGQYNHADIALSTALHHVPSASRWWARLGYAREGARKTDMARDAYNRALALHPSLGEAQRGLERLSRD